MATIVWSDDAIEDVRQIHAYIARHSLLYADRQLSLIESSTDRLIAFPESGRVIPEAESGPYREVLAGSYRVIYRYERDGDLIVIASVVHGRRRLSPSDDLPPT